MIGFRGENSSKFKVESSKLKSGKSFITEYAEDTESTEKKGVAGTQGERYANEPAKLSSSTKTV
jgi:hypothetical protein